MPKELATGGKNRDSSELMEPPEFRAVPIYSSIYSSQSCPDLFFPIYSSQSCPDLFFQSCPDLFFFAANRRRIGKEQICDVEDRNSLARRRRPSLFNSIGCARDRTTTRGY
jgi:hypothetical protein